MKSIIEEDVKGFMGKLLASKAFDNYLLTEAQIVTGISYTINGHLNKDFYDTDEAEALGGQDAISWGEIRPVVYELIKGKKLPIKLKLVLKVPDKYIYEILNAGGAGAQAENVNAMFLNIAFEKGMLVLTSGISLNTFSLDRTAEAAWDSYMEQHVI